MCEIALRKSAIQPRRHGNFCQWGELFAGCNCDDAVANSRTLRKWRYPKHGVSVAFAKSSNCDLKRKLTGLPSKEDSPISLSWLQINLLHHKLDPFGLRRSLGERLNAEEIHPACELEIHVPGVFTLVRGLFLAIDPFAVHIPDADFDFTHFGSIIFHGELAVVGVGEEGGFGRRGLGGDGGGLREWRVELVVI